MVFVVDGYEGVGKSVLAQQMAAYVDPTLHLDRICFSPDEFIKAINNATKYQSIIYDEAYGGMSSRAAMSTVNRTLVSVLAEIRQKNLYVFIVMPCFFELDKYAAVWRSRALIHCYTGEGFTRGRFSFYNQDRKKNLYVLGKKFYNYRKPPPNFFGSFMNGYAVDEGEYREKKLKALGAYNKDKEKPLTRTEKRWKEERDILFKVLRDKKVMSSSQIAELLGWSQRNVNKVYAELLEGVSEVSTGI